MNSLPKTLYLILAAFTVFLLLAPAGMGASIRGLTVDTNEASAEEFCWDATTFGAFCYPVNKHQNFVNDSIAWGERLRIEDIDITHGTFGTSGPSNHVLDEGELVYSTKQFCCKYKLVSELGLSGDSIPEDMGSAFYWKLPFFAKPYIAIENDATQLSTIICMQGGSDKKTLRTGETWDLGKGYTLAVHQVDTDGNKVWFSLEKDGEVLESAIVEADGTVESQAFTATADFGDGNDQLYFVTYVDSVFMGSVDSLAVFKYTWLVDKDNVLVIENGDEYQGLEVKEASETGLVLKNPDTITIDVDSDKKTYFTDSWYFQTSDDGKGTEGIGYILYPAMDLSNPGTYKIRGLTLDTGINDASSFGWDATTFGAFCYPVNKHQNFVNDSIAWGERLWIEDIDSTHGSLGTSTPSNHVLDEGELVYSTKPFCCKYKLVSELGLSGDSIPEDMGSAFYWKLPFFAKPYIAIENDATQLSTIICMQGGSDKKTLRTGETWDLGKGYTLAVHQVDTDGNKVWFSLEKDGEVLESAIVEADGTVESQAFTATADFGDGNDQLYFVTYVDSVFMGSVDSLAVFKYTWLVDKDNVLVIENGDEYQGLEVKEASETGLVLKNPDTITIDVDADKKTYFTDSWYFQTSDEGKGTNGGYIIYPATDVTIEAEPAPESAENELAEVEISPDETNSTADSSGSKASPAPEVRVSNSASSESDDESSEQSPGFGLLTCILGLCAVFVRRK